MVLRVRRKKRNVELRLHLRDMAAQGGLREIQPVGGLRNAQAFRHRNEVAHLGRGHVRRLLFCFCPPCDSRRPKRRAQAPENAARCAEIMRSRVLRMRAGRNRRALCFTDLRHYRIIQRVRIGAKICAAKRRKTAGILCVLQGFATHLWGKLAVKTCVGNCAVMP